MEPGLDIDALLASFDGDAPPLDASYDDLFGSFS
jgi:hypothetical protein